MKQESGNRWGSQSWKSSGHQCRIEVTKNIRRCHSCGRSPIVPLGLKGGFGEGPLGDQNSRFWDASEDLILRNHVRERGQVDASGQQ
jgi:hypothetical protein